MMSSEHSGADVGLPSQSVRKGDREMLDLAARAAGGVNGQSNGLFYQWCVSLHADRPARYVGQREWNPLDDDGDALRLAAKLRIHLRFHLADYAPAVSAQSIANEFTEQLGRDEAAATRRAIVRAAAALAGQDADTEPARSNEQSPSS